MKKYSIFNIPASPAGRQYSILASIMLLLVVGYWSLVIGHTLSVYAQSPTDATTPAPTKKTTSVTTPTPTTSDSLIDKLKQIEKLKDKIATKVAQLRESEKKAIAGTIKKIDTTTLTIQTKTGEYTASFADDTLVFSLADGKKTESSTEKLDANMSVSVFGYPNGNTSLSAKYIYIQNPSLRESGKIVDVDKGDYTITVKLKQGEQLVDIETYTQMYTVSDDTKKKERIGFSKLSQRDTIHLLATPNPKDENRVSAQKLIVIRFASQTPAISPSSSQKVSTKSATPAPTKVRAATSSATKKPPTPTPAVE